MISGYSKNLSVRLMVALLKGHGIKRVIASPGNTNMEFVAALQHDKSFEIYSSVDERSAAYMACGMARESGEPVIITCTEATASRDYFPGLTEAYYRKLPILAVTGVHRYNQIGHLQPQVIDRSVSPNDVFVRKEQLPIIKDEEDIRESELRINRAILELTRRGGGPVHIDLPCCNDDYDFSAKELPKVRILKRYDWDSVFPEIPAGKIAVYIGSHLKFDEKAEKAIDQFCGEHNAVVFHDHTSGYYGKFGVKTALLSAQGVSYEILGNIDLLIHLGESVGDGATMLKMKKVKSVWRVSPDGELRDTFGKLTAVFEMSETAFFQHYISGEKTEVRQTYLQNCKETVSGVCVTVEQLPFSNIYAAAMLSSRFPENAVVHLGLSNTIRAWSLFNFPDTVTSSCNVGCRGIDGVLSSCLGASLVHPEHIYYCILGDLTFFYDMNAIGNRFVGKNLRILMINNNGGCIFKQSTAPAHKYFGDEAANEYIAAAGHFGNQSSNLVKHYAEDLGFEYLCAASKEDFQMVYSRFLTPELTEKPMVFELFTKDEDERKAFDFVSSIEVSMEGRTKQIAKQLLGDKGTKFLKKVIYAK